MIPFRSVYRFNVSHPVLNTTGPERSGTVPIQPVPNLKRNCNRNSERQRRITSKLKQYFEKIEDEKAVLGEARR
ncbi:hypothetical protein H5410_039041 [Solanum commersonii]|uniref:Uncharacterized protein n=1 Tax=Solanum commersonii TaxID=4109 RepID=A0A9J5YBW3_SOLCO|nr:hypothetical protein H5410_039041 [Solanum commersonii]